MVIIRKNITTINKISFFQNVIGMFTDISPIDY